MNSTTQIYFFSLLVCVCVCVVYRQCHRPALRDPANAYIMTYGSQIYQVFAVDRTHLPPQLNLSVLHCQLSLSLILCSPGSALMALLPICLPVYMSTCLPLSLPQVYTSLASLNKPIHQICFVV